MQNSKQAPGTDIIIDTENYKFAKEITRQSEKEINKF